MKKVLIVGGSIALFCLLFMLGCRTLISTISNSNDCKRFNIDNIEVHTGIDIPSVTDVSCIYNDGIKDVTFVLDTSKIEMEEYILKNKLENKNGIFSAHGTSKKSKWNVQLNKETAALDVHIEYLKN